jgi:quercetin dioxygenase-like cupin family protein
MTQEQGQGPVLRVAEYRIAPDNRPPGCAAAGIGVFRICPDATFDPHLHDSAEYWLIYEGKAKVSVDGRTHYAQAGDVVCTPAGAVHDIVEIYEEVEAFYLEEPLPVGGRLGHLYPDGLEPTAHPIPLAPLPGDFPPRSRAGVFGA